MVYTEPAFTEFIDVFPYVNTVTSNVFGYLLIASIFGVIFLALKNWPTEKAFLAAGTITLFCAVPLTGIGAVSSIVLAPLTILVIIGILFNIIRKGV